MSSQSDWLSDIAAAADEAGMAIESVAPGSVVLSTRDERVTVESVFLNGQMLRRLFGRPDPAPVWPDRDSETRTS